MTLALNTPVEWKQDEEGSLGAYYVDEHGVERQATFAPQSGSQEAFIDCPAFEILYEGTRGPGKTVSALMKFCSQIGKWGSSWRGIVLRPEHTQLSDVIEESKRWIPKLFPSATFNEAKSVWQWATGEKLFFRHARILKDYDKYHGQQYPFVWWEELTLWPDDKLYRKMMSICRSTKPGMPRWYISTTNPSGVGHNWVKRRWKLPVLKGQIFGEVQTFTEEFELANGRKVTENLHRVAIHGHLKENLVMLTADPGYIGRLREAADSPAQLAAWMHGDWNVMAGGMFDDLWDDRWHVIPNIPIDRIPLNWRVSRAYDHGQAEPFSVGWYAISNGEPIEIDGRLIGGVRGDIIRFAEWYGWNGTENEGVRMLATEIADGILEREEDWGLRNRVHPGPADAKATDATNSERSVEGEMRKRGVRWIPAHKGKGSRKLGWEQVRKYLKGAIPDEDGYREKPGIFACERCYNYRRTMPTLPRDMNDPNDADTHAEDHCPDEVRYFVYMPPKETKSRSW